jgi:hypothetical protein
MKRNTRKSKWTLYENGYKHTGDLTKEQAEEMLERYTRIFPDLEFYIIEDPELTA